MIDLKEAALKLDQVLAMVKAEVPEELPTSEKWKRFTGLDAELIPVIIAMTLKCEAGNGIEAALAKILIMGSTLGYGHARGEKAGGMA